MAAEAFRLAARGQNVRSNGSWGAIALGSDQFELVQYLGSVEQLIGPDRDFDGEAVSACAGVNAAFVKFLFDRLEHHTNSATVKVLWQRADRKADRAGDTRAHSASAKIS